MGWVDQSTWSSGVMFILGSVVVGTYTDSVFVVVVVSVGALTYVFALREALPAQATICKGAVTSSGGSVVLWIFCVIPWL